MKKAITLILLCFCSIGCFNTERIVPKQYLFNVSQPGRLHDKSIDKTLEVNYVTIAPQFATANFVYRVSDINYIVDFYNVLFVAPEKQINEIMVSYLQAKNIFSYAANDTGQLTANYILKPKITALYADYRDAKQPKAVIAIDYALFSAQGENKPLMHKVYTSEVSLVVKDSDSLVHAWNKGLQQILARLSSDLDKITNQKS